MTVRKNNGGNIILAFGAPLFYVWLLGASIAGMYHNYIDKKQCIQDEGWLKGWLWCSKETKNSFAINMLRGAMWPMEIFAAPDNETPPSSGEIIANILVDQQPQLSVTQRATITERCEEIVAMNKRRYPNIPGPSAELCVMTHSRAALEGEPSLLTMKPSDYEHYVNSRDLSPEEAQDVFKSFDGLGKTCSQLTIKSMLVQPLLSEESSEAVDPDVMAVLVADWEPKVQDAILLHHAALVSHFRNYGLYGTTPQYFLDEFDGCVLLSTAGLGLMRDKDAKSEQAIGITNKYRAEIADMFQKSQGMRDQIYYKE